MKTGRGDAAWEKSPCVVTRGSRRRGDSSSQVPTSIGTIRSLNELNLWQRIGDERSPATWASVRLRGWRGDEAIAHPLHRSNCARKGHAASWASNWGLASRREAAIRRSGLSGQGKSEENAEFRNKKKRDARGARRTGFLLARSGDVRFTGCSGRTAKFRKKKSNLAPRTVRTSLPPCWTCNQNAHRPSAPSSVRLTPSHLMRLCTSNRPPHDCQRGSTIPVHFASRLAH